MWACLQKFISLINIIITNRKSNEIPQTNHHIKYENSKQINVIKSTFNAWLLATFCSSHKRRGFNFCEHVRHMLPATRYFSFPTVSATLTKAKLSKINGWRIEAKYFIQILLPCITLLQLFHFCTKLANVLKWCLFEMLNVDDVSTKRENFNQSRLKYKLSLVFKYVIRQIYKTWYN